MTSTEDTELWDQLKKTVQPLELNSAEGILPPRLKVRRALSQPVLYTLDLHQMTLEEAYQKTIQFIEKHYKIGSQKIQIITGKGREGRGLIHAEFANWLDTKRLSLYIRKSEWTNDEGAMNIWLRKNK